MVFSGGVSMEPPLGTNVEYEMYLGHLSDIPQLDVSIHVLMPCYVMFELLCYVMLLLKYQMFMLLSQMFIFLCKYLNHASILS